MSGEESVASNFYSDAKFDWWTFGILLYLMLTGKSPFNNAPEFQISLEVLLHSEIDVHKNVGDVISDSACTLLQGLLNRNIEQRYCANDIQIHDFYKDVDWNQLYLKKFNI